jgi:hypothetical protein
MTEPDPFSSDDRDIPEIEGPKKKKTAPWSKPAQVVPAFGMEGTFGGANPKYISSEPENREVPSLDDIRARFIRGGLDSHDLVIELKRLVKIGAIPMTPKEIKAIIDAEVSLAETTVRLADTEGQVKGLKPLDDRGVVLQILNQTYNNIAGTLEAERHRRDEVQDKAETIDAEFEPVPDGVSQEQFERIQKFRTFRK